MATLTEIRWHGRAGQGVVTAGELLAHTALDEGKYFQAFPDYGPERSGAPIRAFTRISDEPIPVHCQITEPDVVLVLDPTLIGIVDFTEGIKDDGVLVVNTALSPAELREKIGFRQGHVFTIDATRIALDILNRNVTNTPMMGALLKATPVVDRDSVPREIRKRFTGKLKPEVVEANVFAFEKAYAETLVG
ncbi:MAG: 2-oxoacid:acceptor oxidoreductase family protein [Chloroflexi bacterium]|nr:2-oxoacid:acceptor oxidoreductase family protein [Chloroflexota bacterium]